MKNDFREYCDIDYIIHSVIDAYNDYIEHHGIKGQKWGVQNGPPYPLGSDISTGKSLKTPEIGKKSKEGVMGADDKSAFAILETVWTAELAMIFGRVIKWKAETANSKKLQKKIKKDIDSSETDKKTKLPLKNREYTNEEDLKYINAKYKDHTDRSGSSKSNCVRCTLAYELRKRGYNVTAATSTDGVNGEDFAKKVFNAKKATDIEGYGKPKTSLKDWTQSVEYQNRKAAALEGRSQAYEATVNHMSKLKDQRGQLLVRWGSGYSGHSMIYQIKNGQVTFMDAQCGKQYSIKEAKKLFSHVSFVKYQRLDNCKDINIKMLKEIVNEWRG